MDAGGRLKMGARYDFELIRAGEVVDTFTEYNTVPDAALNDMLSVYLDAGSQSGLWYVALFENDYNMTNAAALTPADIGVTLTECTAYTDARKEVVFSVPASKSTSNSANVAQFAINATKTIYGGFIVNTATKGSTLGTIFSIVKLGSPKAVENGDILKATVTVTAASA